MKQIDWNPPPHAMVVDFPKKEFPWQLVIRSSHGCIPPISWSTCEAVLLVMFWKVCCRILRSPLTCGKHRVATCFVFFSCVVLFSFSEVISQNQQAIHTYTGYSHAETIGSELPSWDLQTKWAERDPKINIYQSIRMELYIYLGCGPLLNTAPPLRWNNLDLIKHNDTQLHPWKGHE